MNDQQLAATERIGGLIFKYLSENITDDELTELHNWVYANKANQDLFVEIVHGEEFQESIKYITEIDTEMAFRFIQDRIAAEERKVVRLPFNRLRYIVAAASVILLLMGTIIIYLHFDRKKDDASHIKAEDSSKNDIVPGGNKAILTLANGSTIVLDRAKNGALTQEGVTKVMKIDSGQLVYAATLKPTGPAGYNTLSTPRGGQYKIVLPDGTNVWLNAASSIRFPVAFVGNSRRVEITGEAYFEVAKDKSKPFYVKTAGPEIQVLGTHFNVMSYQDEPSINTTLLEGSVKLTSEMGSVSLTPGEQSQSFNDDKSNNGMPKKIKVLQAIDTDGVVAWKNGQFHFQNTSITRLMRDLSRWYDIDISYQGPMITQKFTGDIERNLTLRELIDILSDNMKCSVDGRKVIISHK